MIYQFQREFCYQVPEWITCNRHHACPHQWCGIPIDQCENHVCNKLMLQPGTRHPLAPRLSIKEKAEELERRCWILRVARVYRPNTGEKGSRMKGVGFDFVLPENRRTSCMGRVEWISKRHYGDRGCNVGSDAEWAGAPAGCQSRDAYRLTTKRAEP